MPISEMHSTNRAIQKQSWDFWPVAASLFLQWYGMRWSNLRLACNPAIEDLLITSRPRAMKIIDSNYELYVNQLKELIQGSQSMIHISTDLWTSPYRHGVLAVCAQWVDHRYRLRKALLGLPECILNHTGESQATLIVKVLRKLNIRAPDYPDYA